MRDAEPAFEEAWQVEAFALVDTLIDARVFTTAEWSDALGAAIAAAQRAGDLDLGDTYYEHWTAALGTLCVAKGVITEASIGERQTMWTLAYERTPHGHPVELGAG